MADRLKSYDDLVAFLAKAQIPHQADPANFAVQVATKPPALQIAVFVRWEQKIPYIQIIQQMTNPVPDNRVQDVETAVSHVNDVAMIPGYGFSYASKVVYYRLCVPIYDGGISTDDLDKAMTAVLNNAVQLEPAFKKVIEGSVPGAKVLGALRVQLIDELFAARLSSAGELDGRRLFDLVDPWLAQRGPFENWGATPKAAREPAARALAVLREKLHAALAAGTFEPLPLGYALDAIYLWDKVFANPLSIASLAAAVKPPASDDPVIRALYEPVPPRFADAGAVWRAQPTPLRQLLAGIWMSVVPPGAVTAADRDRFVAHATSLTAALPPLQLPIVAPLAHALTINAFGASYAGGNTVAALAAIGRFIAEAMQRHFPRYATRPAPRTRAAGEPIRLGYVSSHWRRHAVTSYMANRILCRDRARFHVTMFAVGGRDDELTAELAASADDFVRIDPNPIDRVAARIASTELDLLVHADVGMDLATHLLAGLYLAPIQIALMGHATSTGMPPITHYLSGDHEPPDGDAHYNEQLIRLPRCGAAQLPPQPAQRAWTRAELGIPADAVVMINLSHALKHGPARDALYAEILARVPRAYLVVKPFFSKSDVDPRFEARLAALGPRVKIVPPLASPGEVTGLYTLADLQLDTFPFGGWTTNLDALHAGLPIVTQVGETCRERWGGRFLELMQISVGAARSDREYVETAVRMASDDALRHQVASEIRAASPQFFDGPAAQPFYENALLDIIDARKA